MPVKPDAPFTPEEALAGIAHVSRMRSSMRSRFEGMTWILWGLVAALQAMTLGFLAETMLAQGPWRHVASLGSHLWIALGIAASVGVWRAAAVSFDPGIGRGRALAFFIGWPAVFSVLSFANSGHSGGGALGLAIVSAAMLLAFAALDPVRYTRSGRWTAAALAAVAATVAVIAWTTGATGSIAYATTGATIGVSWVLAGLYALYRG